MNTKSIPKKSPMLYEDQVGDYLIVFNRSGRGGVVVLDQDVQEIFRLCDGRRSCEEVIATQTVRSQKEARKVFRTLAEREILLIPEIKPQRTKRAKMLNAWIHLTNACNLACDYCYVTKDGSKMGLELAVASVDALYRSVALHKEEFKGVQLTLAGGEPLINLDVFEAICSYSKNLSRKTGTGRHIGVITNGTILNNRIANIFHDHKISVSVSLDGLGKFNRARHYPDGRPSGSKVLKNLERMQRVGLKPFVLITITESNLDGLPELTKYLLSKELGFRYSFLRDLETGANIGYLEDKIITTLNECYDYMERHLPDIPLRTYHRFADSRYGFPVRRSCGIGWSSVRISHRGELFLCQSDINKRGSVGNVSDPDLIESIRTQQILPELQEKYSVDDYEVCKMCEWRYQCGGGCPLLNYLVGGTVGAQSPYCSVFRTFIPRNIRLRGLQLIRDLKERG